MVSNTNIVAVSVTSVAISKQTKIFFERTKLKRKMTKEHKRFQAKESKRDKFLLVMNDI